MLQTPVQNQNRCSVPPLKNITYIENSGTIHFQFSFSCVVDWSAITYKILSECFFGTIT